MLMDKTPKIALIGGYKFAAFAHSWKGQMQALKKMDIPHIILDSRDDSLEHIVGECTAFQPDIILHGLSDSFNTDMIDQLRANCPKAKQIWWYCDYAAIGTGDLENCNVAKKKQTGNLDFMLLTNSEQIPYYEETLGIPCYFLPQAGLLMDELPPIDERYSNIDVLFVGNLEKNPIHSKRTQFLNTIKDACQAGGLNFQVFPQGMNLKDCYDTQHLIYRNAKVALNLSHLNDKKNYSSARLWYGACVGGLMLSANYPGIRDQFPMVPTFNWPDVLECLEKIRYLIEHQEEMEKLRSEIFTHAQKYHTYLNRFKSIFALCRGQ